MTTENKTIASLLSGRNNKPLEKHEINSVSNTIIGLTNSDREIDFVYVPNSWSRFTVQDSDDGVKYGKIIFSDDIFQGTDIISPNSVLSMKAAVCHELTHYHRWKDKRELPHGELTQLDEAMTSLEAILMFNKNLSDNDTLGLVSDALERIKLYIKGE